MADEYKARLMRFCTEEFEEYDKAIEECMSKGDFIFPVTPGTLKVGSELCLSLYSIIFKFVFLFIVSLEL